MAFNILTQSPLSATGVKPGQWFLNSSEDYATITEPGYLSSIAGSGIDIHPNDFVFATYDNNALSGVFTAEGAGDSLSLQVYTANSNSFVFERTMFVAKGGSDLNPGNQIGFPKLNVQAAIDALMPADNVQSLVIVLDDGNYVENLVLGPNVFIQAQGATFNTNSGDLITINDTGMNTISGITFQALANDGGGLVINQLGSQSNLFANGTILNGNIYNEGGLLLSLVALVQSNVHISSTGQFGPKITNTAGTCNYTYDVGSTVVGSIGQIAGPDTVVNIFGNQNVVDRLMYQTKPLAETAGRELTNDDRNVRIVYNNASDDNYTLPNSPDVKLPIGSFVEFTQLGLGAIYFVAGAGVTVVSTQGSNPYSSGPGATCKAYKYTDTIWIVSGDITSIGP